MNDTESLKKEVDAMKARLASLEKYVSKQEEMSLKDKYPSIKAPSGSMLSESVIKEQKPFENQGLSPEDIQQQIAMQDARITALEP